MDTVQQINSSIKRDGDKAVFGAICSPEVNEAMPSQQASSELRGEVCHEWPFSFWEVVGSVGDPTFCVPDELIFEDDGPLPSFDED